MGYPRRLRKSGSELPFEQAKKVLQPLRIPNAKAFGKLSKQRKLPEGIPSSPDIIYKDKGWIDWPDKIYKGKGWRGYADFLGYPRKYMKPGTELPFEQAKKVIQELKIPSVKAFYRLGKQRKLPEGIPGVPDIIYKDKGWNGWPDFLGYENPAWTVRKIK